MFKNQNCHKTRHWSSSGGLKKGVQSSIRIPAVNFVGSQQNPRVSGLLYYFSKSQCYLKKENIHGEVISGKVALILPCCLPEQANFFPQWAVLLYFYKFWLLIRKLCQNLDMKYLYVGISDTVIYIKDYTQGWFRFLVGQTYIFVLVPVSCVSW